MSMKICRHKGMSYHDANNCHTCVPYYRAHTSYDKDGDPYYNPRGDDDLSGLLGLVLIVCLAVGLFV